VQLEEGDDVIGGVTGDTNVHAPGLKNTVVSRGMSGEVGCVRVCDSLRHAFLDRLALILDAKHAVGGGLVDDEVEAAVFELHVCGVVQNPLLFWVVLYIRRLFNVRWDRGEQEW